MFYQIQKQLDDAVRSYGIPVNDMSVSKTDSIKDGIQAFSRVTEIEQTEEQISNHRQFEFLYTIQFVTASTDTSDSGLETRKFQAQKDYLDIISIIDQTIASSSARNLTPDTGEFDANTNKDYQSWGYTGVRCIFAHNTCLPVIR